MYRGSRAVILLAGGLIASLAATAQTVSIEVDAGHSLQPLKPVWSFFGYDEPNFTYMKDGKKLLSELADLSPVPVFVRTHNLPTTGNGTPALKWGSTNAYTEDSAGQPHYDWTIVDRIIDTYLERSMKPFVEIGFMPEALSTKPQPYQHSWSQDKPYSDIYTGWAYPPRDYDKWRELVYQWVSHSVAKYGKAEVESWYRDVWNEPDSGYWKGNPQEYQKLYDYTADGLKRALPSARVGGPHSTRPANEIPAKFLRDFLDHVTRGRNYATGKIGSPIDYIGFHAKGLPVVKDNKVVMGSDVHLRNISKGFEIVASYPALKNLPIIIGESDPEGCAACSVRFNPQNAYRNGTLYAAYTAATFAREYELAKLNNVNFLGAVTWAFEFEGQPYFDGYRDLATNGIDKPVLNVFRMFGLMGGEQIESSSSGQLRLDRILKDGVKDQPDTGSLASGGDRAVSVLVWNYHDNESPGPAADVSLDIKGLPEGKVLLEHYRVDGQHSNSFEAWKSMGSPQNPSAEQYSQLERSGQLQTMGSPYWQSTVSGRLAIRFPLPRHAVSMIRVTW